MALAVGVSVANPFSGQSLLPLGDGTERRRMLSLLAVGMCCCLACCRVRWWPWPLG
jgi:hypothetical protein